MYKPEWLSEGAEVLLERWKEVHKPYDVLIVGSGYGGALAAARLAGAVDEKTQKKLTVCVLERGKEHVPGTFPNSFSELPGHIRYSRPDDPIAKGVREGLFDFRIGEDVTVLVANGLGGGSLINAGVAAVPDPEVFKKERWPAEIQKEWRDAETLEAHFGRLCTELGANSVTTDRAGQELDKYKQFQAFAGRIKLEATPAPITVHDTCVRCGDCATGCNVGAKNTLSTNYLAAAKGSGAEIYTGVTVSHVEKRAGEWAVLVSLTIEPKPLQEQKLHEIRARTVILAAGALGSPEILMRSKARSRDLRISDWLGKRFSTNGDMIAALYKKGESVNAAPQEHIDLESRKVGPTITGITRCGDNGQRRIVIEELALPGALRRVFEEVVTTSAMLASLGQYDNSTHQPISEVDPAAVDPRVIDGCQVFAAMGDDDAKGQLELVRGWNDPVHLGRVKDGAIRIHWPEAGQEEVYRAQDDIFQRAAKDSGWTYLRNPLWQPLPAGISSALSGKKPTGMVFSVHPLGGCPMGPDIDNGVVDHAGRVFAPDTPSGFHDGLLVLDGSIVPTALGVNPLLTITALAERAIKIHANKRWTLNDREVSRVAPPPGIGLKPVNEAVTAFRFSERMTGELSFPGGSSQLTELTLDFARVDNLLDFLRQPQVRRDVTGKVRILEPGSPKIDVKGEVRLLERGASGSIGRTVRALVTYLWTRAVPDWLESRDERRSRGPKLPFWAVWRRLKSLFVSIRGYIALASRVGETRHLFYQFKLQAALTDAKGNPRLPDGTEIRGQKILKYGIDTNPWRQLIDLAVTAHLPDGKRRELGKLTVDPAYFFRGFESRFRITSQRDLPSAWMDLASLGLFLARIILKIHFWNFRLPGYQKYDPMRDVRRLPGKLRGWFKALRMERHMVGYPETPRDAGIFLPITRYRRKEHCPQGPVVLFHGLGSGGIQFATATVKRNMAQHLAAKGFDVWVAELRTSIALPYSLDQWTLDEVARQDIPRIIDLVLEKTRERQTNVVAHCIGSAMFCTAVLDGKLQHTNGESKVRRAVLLQVGPLITLSKGTRLRGLVAAPLRRFFPEGHVDFSVDNRASWREAMIDRLLNTYPYPPKESKEHALRWWRLGKRNRHIANCNRWAAIDGRMFQHDNLSAKTLDALGDVLGHSSLTTWAQTIQYAFLERLTDSEARNSYVTAENMRAYFTFPVRFLHGSENDVFDPLTSLRSQELIQRIHGRHAAEVEILDNYGHFDPLIGRKAEKDVFRRVSSFLDKDYAVGRDPRQAAQTHDNYYVRRPLIGPVLGWLRWDEKAATWRARVWCRIDDLRSPVKCVVVQVFRKDATGLQSQVDGQELDCKVVWCPTVPEPGGEIDSLVAGPIDTILCVDMDLGKGGTYEIVVLSVHESIEEEPSDRPRREELRQAELAAGKRSSALAPPLHIRKAGPTLEQTLKNPNEILRLRDEARGQPGDAGYDDKIDHAKVTVPDKPEADTLTFALTSCRYPGWMFDRRRADAMFGQIKRGLKDPEKPSALFLVGDQIYADATAGAFDPKDRRERFYEAYREAWTGQNARKVLSRIPVYMMMDDHEAGNDWHPRDLLNEEEKMMRAQGIEAFRQYQWLHSPGNFGQPRAPADGDPEIFYYDFDLRGFPVFVCDTRSGRSGRCLLDERQYEVLERWLETAKSQYKDKPKFVVSPSVVVPFLDKLNDTGEAVYPTRSDGWDGFPEQLKRLFSFIVDGNINNVVFLCGDSHLSMHSEIWFEDAGGQRQPLQAYCIMASPMYAPYPFANSKPHEYVLDNVHRKLKLPGGGFMRYEVTGPVAKNSFTLATAAKGKDGRWEITSQVLPAEPREKDPRKPDHEDSAVVSADRGLRREVRPAA